MLAGNGIKLFDLHLLGHGAFVFRSGIEVAGASRGLEFDLFTHGSDSLNRFAAGAQLGNHGL
jgi:hypothetical protein